MKITESALKNPAVLAVIVAMIVLFGILAIKDRPIQLLPNLSQPQISIFNNTGVNTQLPFFAIPTTGIPHLSRISPETIKAVKTEPGPYETMHVNIDGGVAVIPDISSLERACVEALNL